MENPTHDIPSHEVVLVGQSYARVEARIAALAALFWSNLFAVAPDLRRLFPYEDGEKRALAATLFDFVVTHLRSTNLSAVLEKMGARGLLVGVTQKEMDAIGESLIGALSELEGTDWDDDTARAWAQTFLWTASTVRNGARTRHSFAP